MKRQRVFGAIRLAVPLPQLWSGVVEEEAVVVGRRPPPADGLESQSLLSTTMKSSGANTMSVRRQSGASTPTSRMCRRAHR